MGVYCAGRKKELELPTTPLAEGAEGQVFLIPSEPGILAKIFFEPAVDNRRDKVEQIVAHPFADPPATDGHRRFAAPQEILLDHAAGAFVGYTMPLIPNAEALDEFFDPQGKRYRRDKTSFRVGLAISVAELVAEVHRHHLEITLGDLKPRNILADDMGRVALVDLDSVQLTTLRGATYLCPVASEYYKAPEVYRMDLRRQRREPSVDLFALAVIVFQLLLGGWHPFAAAGDLDLVGRIRRGEFPHVAGSPDRPPPGAPPFSALPVELQTIFIQAFVDGHWDAGARPTADVFVEALKRNAKALAHPKAVAPAATKAPAAAGRPRRVVRRGVAAVAAVAVAAISLGFFGVRWLHGEARAPEFASATMWDPGSAVTDDFRDPPRDPEEGTGTPRYWRRLRDGSDGRLSFEIADGTDTRRQP